MPADPHHAVADDRRDDLEALMHREKIPAPLVAKFMTAADAYANAARPPVPSKAPVVHYAIHGGKRTACLPGEFSTAGQRRQVTTDAQAVTCQRCRKADPWLAAATAPEESSK